VVESASEIGLYQRLGEEECCKSRGKLRNFASDGADLRP
jgi:hypothetical protein